MHQPRIWPIHEQKRKGRPALSRQPLDRLLPGLAVLIVAFSLLGLGSWLYQHPPGLPPIPTPSPVLPPNAPLAVPPPVPAGLPGPLNTITPHLNGIPIDEIVVVDQQTIEHTRQVYALGQSSGRNPHAFSKVGDSTIESPHFMDYLDTGKYNLGEFAYLQPVVDYFTGSYARQGAAVLRGLHSWSVFDPMWAKDPACQPGEGPLDCEIRLHNPAFILVRLGSNDVGRDDLLRQSLEEMVTYCLERGILPVIGTKADRYDGPDNTNNLLLRQLAAEYHLPLWDFDLVAQTLPASGLRPGGVHLTYFSPPDYTQPNWQKSGYAIHNLVAMMILYEILRVLSL